MNERAKLLAKRDELEARLEAIKRDYRSGLDADSTERAVQLENAEVLEAIVKATSEELDNIARRIAELDDSSD